MLGSLLKRMRKLNFKTTRSELYKKAVLREFDSPFKCAQHTNALSRVTSQAEKACFCVIVVFIKIKKTVIVYWWAQLPPDNTTDKCFKQTVWKKEIEGKKTLHRESKKKKDVRIKKKGCNTIDDWKAELN